MTATSNDEVSLVNAVQQLTRVVQELQSMIRDDYPKREEIERDFVTKYGIRKRRRQWAIGTVVAIVASYFWTMGTVSYCFLSSDPDGETDLKTYCLIIPGYKEAVERNQRLVTVFNHLIDTTEANSDRLDELEKSR